MKTLVKKSRAVDEKVKSQRRHLNNAVKSLNNSPKQKSEAFVLHKNDYQDLIEIKEDRAQKAEQLRSMYFFVGLTVTLVIVNLIFGWKFDNNGMVNNLGDVQNASFEELMEPPKTNQLPPPPPKVLQQAIIVEVPDEEILEEIDIEIDVEVTEDMAVEDVIFEEIIEEEEVEEIFQIVETSPEPVGGYGTFYKYVSENIRYPSEALRLDVSGKVFVKFVVDKNGNIRDVHAVKGIGAGCDEEAIRIIENSPKWNPGKQRGKNVSVYMMLPITFMLKE